VGNSDLVLHFDFSDKLLEKIRQELDEHGRATPRFEMRYVREDGEICTTVRNTIAIRPKGYISPKEPAPEASRRQFHP
jgi:hypothetical protein